MAAFINISSDVALTLTSRPAKTCAPSAIYALEAVSEILTDAIPDLVAVFLSGLAALVKS